MHSAVNFIDFLSQEYPFHSIKSHHLSKAGCLVATVLSHKG